MKNEVFTKGKKVFVGIEIAEWIEFLMRVQALEDSATSLVVHMVNNNDIESVSLATRRAKVLTDFSSLQKYMSKYTGALSEDLEATNKRTRRDD